MTTPPLPRAAASIVVFLLVVASCAAPPIGIGAGARRRALGQPAVATAWGVGVARDHETYQLEASGTVARPRPWLAVEAGGVIDAVSARDGNRSLLAVSGFPYLRARFERGALSLAITGAAAAAAGGEGGAVGGFGDAQVGVGGERWSLYGGAYALGYAEAAGGPTATALQARVGAELLVPVGKVFVGVALEAYRHTESLRATPDVMAFDQDGTGFGLKLRFEADHSLRSLFR